MLHHILPGAGDRIELGDPVDLVPEKLHLDGQLAHIGQVDVHRIPPDPELVANKIHVVALVLQIHQAAAQIVPVHLHAGAQADDHTPVVDGVAQE